MSPERAWREPSPSDCERFLPLVASGVNPYDAAREDGYTASAFRRLANHDPEFAQRYAEAKIEGQEARGRSALAEQLDAAFERGRLAGLAERLAADAA